MSPLEKAPKPQPQSPSKAQTTPTWQQSLTQRRAQTRRLTQLALFFALALLLSWFENLLPPPPVPVPVRYGLSNIAVMACLFFWGLPSALLLAVLKAGWVLMLRGAVAGLLSLGGGVMAVLMMGVFLRLFGERISYLLLSVIGAITHNFTQYLLVSLLYIGASLSVLYPFLILTGVVTGAMTALLLKCVDRPLRRHLLAASRSASPIGETGGNGADPS